MTEMPYRLCLAGGWSDQPWVSARAPGSVVVVQIEAPDAPYMRRSGLATSTRQTATKLWGVLPTTDRDATARALFACENPPGCKYISGSQDAIGLVYPGASRLDYIGEYWPVRMEHNTSAEVARWLERVLHLVPFKPRPEGYDPLIQQRVTPKVASDLGNAGRLAWAAILNQNVDGLAVAMNETTAAWRAMLPLSISPEMEEFRGLYSEFGGSGFTGCGGGYLMVVCDRDVPGSKAIRVSLGKG